MTEPESLFVPSGDRWLPTDFARGPWSPEALHGGPVAALVARAVEACEPAPQMALTRLTLELLKPVPLTPLEVSASLSRPGRKIQVVDVAVSGGGRDLAWGRAVRIRTVEEGMDELPETERKTPNSLPSQVPRFMNAGFAGYPGFANAGAELRFAEGAFIERGPSFVWIRLRVPVVPGEQPSPLQRAVAAADFGNGVSAELPFDRFTFVNPDLTVHLTRPPIGEWVGLEARTDLGQPGTALAESRLWDENGPIGRSLQGLYIERRGS